MWASKNKKTTQTRLLLSLPLPAGSSGLAHEEAGRDMCGGILSQQGIEVRKVGMERMFQGTDSLRELCQVAVDGGDELQVAMGEGLGDAYQSLLGVGDYAGAQRIAEMVCDCERSAGALVYAFFESLLTPGRMNRCVPMATV